MTTQLDAAPASQDDVLYAYVDEAGDYLPPHAPARSPTLAEMLAAADPREDEIGLAPTGDFEPGLRAALHDVIEELLAGSEAARDANASLRRQGDPLGLMDGDGITNEAPETNAPTPERVAGRGVFDAPEVTSKSSPSDRDRKTEAWRHVPLVEAMIRRGQIHKDYASAYQEAARRFYRDFVAGHRGASVTARYGELTGGGGTPASQQTPRTYTDKFGREFEILGPEDRRYDANKRWMQACYAIGVVKCPHTGRPHPSETLHWMLVLVCEDYSVASERTPSLEDAGRSFAGYKSNKQASAAGVALIKSGLERLVVHYGIG